MAPRFRPHVLCAAALLVSTPAFAQQPQTSESTPTKTTMVEAAGQKVGIDPATGRVRALTAEEASQLVEGILPAVSQSDEGLLQRFSSSGAVGVNLEGRFEAATLAKINPDGTVSAECVTSEEEARTFLGDDALALTPKPVTAQAEPELEER